MGRIYYGYRIVAASCVIQMMYLGGMFSYGVFFPELEAEFRWSRATISGASSMMFMMMNIIITLSVERPGPAFCEMCISG